MKYAMLAVTIVTMAIIGLAISSTATMAKRVELTREQICFANPNDPRCPKVDTSKQPNPDPAPKDAPPPK